MSVIICCSAAHDVLDGQLQYVLQKWRNKGTKYEGHYCSFSDQRSRSTSFFLKKSSAINGGIDCKGRDFKKQYGTVQYNISDSTGGGQSITPKVGGVEKETQEKEIKVHTVDPRFHIKGTGGLKTSPRHRSEAFLGPAFFVKHPTPPQE